MKWFNQKDLGNPKQLGTYPDIDSKSYFLITHEMIKTIVDHGLSKEIDLHVYAIVKGMIENTENHIFYGSSNYLATRVYCNIPAAQKALRNLTKENLIVKLYQNKTTGTNVYTLPEYVNHIITDAQK